MKIRIRKILPFFSIIIAILIIINHLGVSAQVSTSTQLQCSIAPVKEIPKLDKNRKPIIENGRETKEVKKNPLKMSSLSINKIDDLDQKIPTLGDRVIVKIDGLSEAIDNGKIYKFNQETQSNILSPFYYQNLVLQLKGYPLNGLHPTRLANKKDYLEFKLAHFGESNEAWSSIFGSALNYESDDIAVTVGCPNGDSISLDENIFQENNKFNIVKIRLWGSLRGFIILIPVGVLVISFFFGINSPILRGDGISKNRSYSLGRTQLAWWSYLIFFSFLALFAITGNYSNIITSQSMILLGIGSGTTLASAFIDSGKKLDFPDRQIRIKELDIEIDRLDKEIKKTKKISKNDLSLIEEARKLEQKKDLKSEINGYELQSKNFVTDLLKDANGEYNLHRYQIFIWTIILGAIFIYQVIITFKMPEFDATLLALQGISSGTFLALKAQGEKPAAPSSSGGPETAGTGTGGPGTGGTEAAGTEAAGTEATGAGTGTGGTGPGGVEVLGLGDESGNFGGGVQPITPSGEES